LLHVINSSRSREYDLVTHGEVVSYFSSSLIRIVLAFKDVYEILLGLRALYTGSSNEYMRYGFASVMAHKSGVYIIAQLNFVNFNFCYETDSYLSWVNQRLRYIEHSDTDQYFAVADDLVALIEEHKRAKGDINTMLLDLRTRSFQKIEDLSGIRDNIENFVDVTIRSRYLASSRDDVVIQVGRKNRGRDSWFKPTITKRLTKLQLILLLGIPTVVTFLVIFLLYLLG